MRWSPIERFARVIGSPCWQRGCQTALLRALISSRWAGSGMSRLVSPTTGGEVCRAVQLGPLKPTLSQFATASHLGRQTQRTRGLDSTYTCAANTFRSIRESETSMDLSFLVACRGFLVQQ